MLEAGIVQGLDTGRRRAAVGVVHDDIDRAVCPEAGLHQLLHIGLVRDVARQKSGTAARIPNGLRNRFSGVLIDVGNEDRGPSLAQPDRCARPTPSPAPVTRRRIHLSVVVLDHHPGMQSQLPAVVVQDQPRDVGCIVRCQKGDGRCLFCDRSQPCQRNPTDTGV